MEAFAGLKEVKTTRRRRPLDGLSSPSSVTTPSVTHAASSSSRLLLPAHGAPDQQQTEEEDPFRLPLPGVDDDDEEEVGGGGGGSAPGSLITEMDEASPPLEAPTPPRPFACPTLAGLVEEYGGCVDQGAWGQAKACLERLTASAADGERPRALAAMAGALLASLPQRGWHLAVVGGTGETGRRVQLRGHGAASASPERLEAEVLAPLRAAVASVPWEGYEEGEAGAEAGESFVLALRLEAVAGRDQKEASAAAERAVHLFTARPGLLSLHCCGLALALWPPHGGPPPPPSHPPAPLLDCILAALALSLPTPVEVESTMRGLSTAADGLLPPWDVDEPPFLVLPPGLAARATYVRVIRVFVSSFVDESIDQTRSWIVYWKLSHFPSHITTASSPRYPS